MGTGGEDTTSDRTGRGGENTLPPMEARVGLGGGDTLLGILDNESLGCCEPSSPELDRGEYWGEAGA